MQSIDLIYYLAGAFLFGMARADTLISMRIWYLGACLLFVLYGLLAKVWPVAIMNGVIIALQLFRMRHTGASGG